MKVVVNTTPIISLAAIGRLDLLEQLFGKITIAEAVYQEIKAKQSYGTDEMTAKGRWYSAAVYRAFFTAGRRAMKFAAPCGMDAELAGLEARRVKTRNLKQAIMQELLTGRTRLVENGKLKVDSAR